MTLWIIIGCLCIFLLKIAPTERKIYIKLAVKEANSPTLWNVIGCLGISMASFTILLKDLKYKANNLYYQKLLSKLIRIIEYSSEKLLSGAIDILAFMLGIMISRTFTELPFSNDVFYYFIIGTSFFVFFFLL